MSRLRNSALIVAVAIACFALGRLQSTRAKTAVATGKKEASVTPVPENRLNAIERTNPDTDTSALQLRLHALEKLTPCEDRENERVALLEKLAATDPATALAYAKANFARDRLAQAESRIAMEWAKHDPAGAWKWARSLGPAAMYHAHTVLEQISRDHPDQAGSYVAEFAQSEPNEAVAITLTAMRGMTETGNFSAALRLANDVSLSSLGDKAVLMNFMAGQWAHFDPNAAAQWVQSLPSGELKTQALVGLGESWAEVDPPSAANFASQLPEGEQRQLALKQAISNWIAIDPGKASEWVNNFEPSPDFDQAVASVATMRELMEAKVDVALSWANSIYNEPLRTAALSEILSHWSVHDHAAAMNYVSSLTGISTASRQQLLQQLQPSGAPSG